jgi:hypothetical protein
MKTVVDTVVLTINVFTQLRNMFRTLPINDQDINNRGEKN